MFSIYKISSFAIAAAISASLLLSVTSIATAAETSVAAPGVQAASINEAKAQISRREAKQIVKDYLKDSGKKGLRVSSVRAQGDYWMVSVKTATGLQATTMKVDKTSGDVSRA